MICGEAIKKFSKQQSNVFIYVTESWSQPPLPAFNFDSHVVLFQWAESNPPKACFQTQVSSLSTSRHLLSALTNCIRVVSWKQLSEKCLNMQSSPMPLDFQGLSPGWEASILARHKPPAPEWKTLTWFFPWQLLLFSKKTSSHQWVQSSWSSCFVTTICVTVVLNEDC